MTMAKLSPPRSFSAHLLLACLLAVAPAACGSPGPGPETDAGSDSSVADAGHDAGTDLGPPPDLGGGSCENVVCDQPFFRCVAGTCTEYPRCFTSATCPGGHVCTGLHCVPEDVDIDGDGYAASEDCNEADPTINPGATETCGLSDQNCSGTADEGDPQALCASDPSGDVCMSSICCPFGTFNFDGDPGTGCECTGTPAVGAGATCAGAIGVGALSDAGAGQSVTVTGSALPAGREVWYRFTATDTADTSCDNFHVRVRFLQNPGNRYVFNIYRGCGTVLCDGNAGYRDANWGTDVNAAGRVGQCPCGNDSGTLNTCGNESQDFMVRVRWEDTSNPTCAEYELEFSNGVF